MARPTARHLHDALRRAGSTRFTPAVQSEGSDPGPPDALARRAHSTRSQPSPAARELLRRLGAYALRNTAARFPHVLEAIARDWADPNRMHATLDALMYDERGGRAGFPPDVLLELAAVRDCYERFVAPRTTRGR
jgi:hypothetical protein